MKTTLSHKVMVAIAAMYTALAGLSGAGKLSAEDAASPQLPIEAFAKLPYFNKVKISPGAENLAYFVNKDGVRHILTQTLDGKKPRLLPPPEGLYYRNFFWANDRFLVLQLGLSIERWGTRVRNLETRTVSYDLKNDTHLWLGKPKGVRLNYTEFVAQQEIIIDRLRDDPMHLLMQMDFSLEGKPAVYRVNIQSGKRKRIQRSKTGIQRWYTDKNHNVRLGFGYKGKTRYAQLKTIEGDWLDLTQTSWWEDYDVLGFTEEATKIHVSGPSPYGTRGLFELDLNTGQITRTLFAHESVDIENVIYHPVTGHLAGVTYRLDVPHDKYFDIRLGRLQRSLERVLPGKYVRIAGQAQDREYYLIFVSSPTEPGDYYFYNSNTKKLTHLGPIRIMIARALEIAPHILPGAVAVKIPMRDKVEIPGYLTLPIDKAGKNLPTVVIPHGGPTSRDSAVWDYWTQFYASRGYAVLRPNFRGSSGYGFAFREAGKKQWGGLMQDDVTDATRWMIKECIADPDRICIVGASYGGYAALMGPIKEPGLYRCAISVNGVTDLPRLKSSDKNYIGGRVWIEDMGLAGVDDKDVSPYDRADELTLPVMVIASKDDARVPYRMSRALHSRLKKRRDDAEYVEIESGGHSMVTSQARLIMLRETERFLAKHLGGH